MSLQPKTEWSFSAALADVDVPRILREGFEAGGAKAVIRFTVAGKVYTAWRNAEYPHCFTKDANALSSSDDHFEASEGTVWIISSYGRETGTQLRVGDWVERVLGVKTTVEVFGS